MNQANSYSEWKSYATDYDKLQDLFEWKKVEESTEYDWKYIKSLTQSLRELRTTERFMRLIHVIRSHSVRNLGNIIDSSLYLRSFSGTKSIIEDFHQEMIKCIEYISTIPEKCLSRSKKLEFLSETRHAFGRTALVFSGGASLGQYHYGLIKCLIEEDLMPRVVSGSSAGSVFASLLCTKTKEELEVFKDPKSINIPDYFEKNSDEETVWNRLKRLMTKGYYMKVEDIGDFLKRNIGDITFQEAYDRTGWILNIAVTGQDEHDGYRLLNYLTAPNVLIWSAACASCAVPYVFAPVDLYCKDEEGEIVPYIPEGTKRYIDGTLTADVPIKDLSEMFNVNCLIVSQVNPLITMFLNRSEHYRHSKVAFIFKFLELLKDMAGSELQHRVKQFVRLRIFPKAIARFSTILTQQYSGHVTIWPTPTLTDLIHILDHPNRKSMTRGGILGARGCYSKLNHVEAVLGVEKALQKAHALVRQSKDERETLSMEEREEDLENNSSKLVDWKRNSAETSEGEIEEVQIVNKWRLKSFSIPRSSSHEDIEALIVESEMRTSLKKTRVMNEEELPREAVEVSLS